MTPAAGLFFGLTPEEYNAIPAIRATELKAAMESAAHVRWMRDHPDEDSTASLRKGAAIDYKTFTPAEYAEKVVTRPAFTGEGSKKAREEWSAAQAAAKRTVLTPGEAEDVARMADALRASPLMQRILAWPGARPQAVAVWFDEEFKAWCKARMDWLCPGETGIMFDLKSCASLHPDTVRYAMKSYRYDIGAFHYIRGFRAVTGVETPFVFGWVMNQGPHLVEVGPIGDESLEVGGIDWKIAMDRIVGGEQTGLWPGYHCDHTTGEPVVTTFDLPEAYLKTRRFG